MSDRTTNGIRVRVDSFYVEERSVPREDYYFFAYRVSISNEGEAPVRLLSREWIITDGNGAEQRVVGPGVVGEQPHLTPGQSFEYTSFCPLRTTFGTMHGTYTMVTDDGDNFQAVIDPFVLSIPHAVN